MGGVGPLQELGLFTVRDDGGRPWHGRNAELATNMLGSFTERGWVALWVMGLAASEAVSIDRGWPSRSRDMVCRKRSIVPCACGQRTCHLSLVGLWAQNDRGMELGPFTGRFLPAGDALVNRLTRPTPHRTAIRTLSAPRQRDC